MLVLEEGRVTVRKVLMCQLTLGTKSAMYNILRTFAQNFSNIDFFLKILPLKDHELVMSEM